MSEKLKPKISLCMIVKNEEEFLPGCLESVKSFIDEIIIVDTGSTDRTIQIAEQYGAKIWNIPWEDDFSKARNVSLEHATGDWILHLDADEQIEKQDIELLLSVISSNKAEAYFLQIVNCNYETTGDSITLPSIRLWRNREEYRFQGALHEQIAASIVKKTQSFVITPIRIYHYGYSQKVVQDKNKSARNLRIALAEVERYPKLSFAHYNLAMEYARINNENAIKEFKLAIETLSNTEEMFVPSLFRNFAGSLIGAGRFKEAIDILDKGLNYFPDYIDLLFQKATCYIQLQQYPPAVGLFHQCIVTPENPRYVHQKGLNREKAHFCLGNCYMRLNRLNEAVYHLKKAYELNSEFKEPLKQLEIINKAIGSQNP